MAQIEHKIQLLLAQNNGVGVVGGSYAPGLPITLVSELALNALGYAAEDNDLNREIAEYILTGAGAAVTSARNGRWWRCLKHRGRGVCPCLMRS